MTTTYYPLFRVGMVISYMDGTRQEVNYLTPKSVSVEVKDYREADTFSFTFDNRIQLTKLGKREVVPGLDITKIAGIVVKILAKSQTGTRYRAQMLGPGYVSMPATGFSQMLVGTSDEITITNDDEVTVTGRDLTGLLIDPHISEQLADGLWYDMDLINMIEMILSFHPLGAQFESVEYFNVTPAEAPKKLPSVVKKQSLASKADISYWDLMTSLCSKVGFICFVQGKRIYISKPRNYMVGKTSTIQFTQDKDCTVKSIKKKIGYKGLQRVRLRSYDSENGVTQVVTHPSEAVSATLNIDSGNVFEKYISWTGNLGHLGTIAEQIFERQRRQRTTATLSTVHMAVGPPLAVDIPNVLWAEPGETATVKMRNGKVQPWRIRAVAHKFDYVEGYHATFEIGEYLKVDIGL